MRLRLVKNLKKKDYPKAIKVYRWLGEGKLKRYTNQNGDLMFDLDEYIAYRKVEHRGRKPKNSDSIVVDMRRNKKNEKRDGD